MERKLAARLCLLALFVLAGCSSDSDGVLVPSTTEAAAEQLTGEVINPTLGAINRYTLDGVLTGPQPGILGEGCTEFSEACSSGMLELCFSASGQSYDFSSCRASSGGMMLDGMIAESQGSMTYDISVDGVAYAGTFDLTYAGNCVTESPSGFGVTSDSSTSTLSGTLTYCESQTRPSGSATFGVAGAVGSWTMALTMDHSDVATAVATNLTTQSTESCTIDLGANQATCSPF